MPPSEVKRDARQSLKGKWGTGICIFLAFMLISWVSSFLGIISTIINVPLSLGFVISFMKLTRGEEVSAFGFLEDGFNRFGKSWGIAWHTFIRLFIPILCMILVMVIFLTLISMNTSSRLINRAISAADNYQKALEQEQAKLYESKSTLSSISSYDSESINLPSSITTPKESVSSSSFIDSPLFTILFIVLYIATYIYTFSRSLLYVLAHNICYDNPELSSKECVLRSAELMKGNRGNYFMLFLSFIGWIILSAFTLYIGLLWLIPYIQVTSVCFYDRLINSKKAEAITE